MTTHSSFFHEWMRREVITDVLLLTIALTLTLEDFRRTSGATNERAIAGQGTKQYYDIIRISGLTVNI